MEQLKDIKDLNQISIWPLAYGWWIVLFVAVAIGGYFVFRNHKQKLYENSWRYLANVKLESLKKDLLNPLIIGDVFELLKEVALKKFKRSECANLTGLEWLKWLNDNQVGKFDWVECGKELVQIQYASKEEIKKKLKDKGIQEGLNKIINVVSQLIRK